MTEKAQSPATAPRSIDQLINRLNENGGICYKEHADMVRAFFAVSEIVPCKAVSGCRGAGEYAEQIFTCEECGDVTQINQCPKGRNNPAPASASEYGPDGRGVATGTPLSARAAPIFKEIGALHRTRDGLLHATTAPGFGLDLHSFVAIYVEEGE